MADFKKYADGTVEARKVEDSETVATVGNITTTANKGDYVVKRPESTRGVYDVVSAEDFDKYVNKSSSTEQTSDTENVQKSASTGSTNSGSANTSGNTSGNSNK